MPDAALVWTKPQGSKHRCTRLSRTDRTISLRHFPGGREGGVMGLHIKLIDCNGEVLESIGDPRNLLHKLLPPADEDSDCILDKIDWYGDTYFNYLQMKRFLAEWEQLAHRAQAPEEQALGVGVRTLAMRCQKDRSLLRFIGD